MIFRQEMLDKILAGAKTVTRRSVRYNESGKYLPARYKVGGGPGGTYALQAGAKTIPGFRLYIASVTMEKLGTISDRDARLEGFRDRTAFLVYWAKLYGQTPFAQSVWRYEFELVESGS